MYSFIEPALECLCSLDSPVIVPQAQRLCLGERCFAFGDSQQINIQIKALVVFQSKRLVCEMRKASLCRNPISVSVK